jgi:uncharacterized protein YjbI with pentapeptide repeats
MLRYSCVVRYSCALVGGFLLLQAGLVRADIYQWEYVNLADHSQGVQQSSTLAPGGAGVDGVPGDDLDSLDLTMGYLVAHDLTSADLSLSNLTNAEFSQANLSGTFFQCHAHRG